jgi:hypothetical protein
VLLGSPLAAGVAAHEGVDAHVAGSCVRGGEGGGRGRMLWGFGSLVERNPSGGWVYVVVSWARAGAGRARETVLDRVLMVGLDQYCLGLGRLTLGPTSRKHTRTHKQETCAKFVGGNPFDPLTFTIVRFLPSFIKPDLSPLKKR